MVHLQMSPQRRLKPKPSAANAQHLVGVHLLVASQQVLLDEFGVAFERFGVCLTRPF